MRDLLPHLELSSWTTISVVVWMAVFVLLMIWVYRPSARRHYEEYGRLPLEEGKKESRE